VKVPRSVVTSVQIFSFKNLRSRLPEVKNFKKLWHIRPACLHMLVGDSNENGKRGRISGGLSGVLCSPFWR